MAVLATPDWLYNTRDNTMDIPTRQQRTSPATEPNSQQQQQQQHSGQHHFQQQQQQHFQQHQQQLLQQQQQMLLAAQQQSFAYPIQQQPHGSWTPNITAPPFYPSFFQQQQQQAQPFPSPQGSYFDPANAQMAAQWAYQQMMFNSQHVFPQSQRQNHPTSANILNPFPSGTPPPPAHRQMSADPYPGFHPYRRPNRQQSASADQERRQGPPHPPYARPDASASSSSISSSGSRQRTNSNQSIKSNNNSSNSRRGSPVSAAGGPNSARSPPTMAGAGSGPTSPNASQPANPSPLRQPHHRNSSTSSTSTTTSIRPGAPVSPSLPTSSISTTSATATTTSTVITSVPRPSRPSPLSQGTFTASEKRISRDDIDLGALQEATQRESSRSGGLKGRLRRALSFSTAQVLKEEDADDQDDDVSIKASQINKKVKGKETAPSTATASGSSSNANLEKPSSASTNLPDSGAVDDGSSTRTPLPKKKSRAASLFNSRMNMSTDNISLSSTVSSASVMIRKLGAMGKLARRNSLAGIASLFKDKDGESKDTKGKKKDKKHSAKAEASEASVSHVTAELDRMGGDWTVNSADLQGLTPAAKLARQHTLKSNAEAAVKAKEAAAAAAARDAEVTAAASSPSLNGNGVAGVATWDRNTATRQGSPIKPSLATNVRINEDGTRTLIEDDDDESDDERHYGHPSPSSLSYSGSHPHSDGWDDDEDWELEGDEDVTIRGADVSSGRGRGSFDEDGFGHPHAGAEAEPGHASVEMEPWAVNNRRSIERSIKPKKGILRNAQSYDQTQYLQHDHPTIVSRGRSNSYTSTNTTTEIGPLARMPSPDPDHIDGLRHNTRSSPTIDAAPFSLPPLTFEASSPLNVSFPSSKDISVAPPMASSHSENQGQNRTSAIFQNPSFNSSAPALSLSHFSASSKPPPTLTHRSHTAPTKRLIFASNLSVYDTFPSVVYDRRSEPATWNRLTPALAQRIKEELNSYKMEEMEVHAASRIHTQFFV